MKCPQAVGDLLMGEQYVLSFSIDIWAWQLNLIAILMFFSSLQYCEVVEIVILYDIACQWSVNLWEWMKLYLHWMHTNPSGKSFHFLIPQFHLLAHIMACQNIFSFNFNQHVGRTDGEAPEQGWAQINPVATSTSKMGPGHCWDTLDDHFGDGNWRNIMLMG